jgi:hypothetical protein
MDQLNAPFLKRLAVQLASGTAEIVDANDLMGRLLIEKSMRKAAADKPADTGDKNFHLVGSGEDVLSRIHKMISLSRRRAWPNK